MDDLNHVIELLNMALEATSLNHSDQVALFRSMGKFYGVQYKRTKVMDDLNVAIKFINIAMERIPLRNPN